MSPGSPIVSEGPENGTEIPLNLPPTSNVPARGFGSAYGPVSPPVSRGFTGASRDIRYRQPGVRYSDPVIVEPPRIIQPRTTQTTPDPEVSPRPSVPKQNGNGQKPATNGTEKGTTPTDEATGIPHYAIVEANVATGGQPTLDGMKWLKERGFRTILNLLPDSDADPAEPSMVRELELEYVSLPVTAASIDRATVEMFNQIADDAKYRPLFIHDSTGAHVGALWYLHRVTVDNVPEDRARSQAARIGLKDTDTELWIAIQRYLAENK